MLNIIVTGRLKTIHFGAPQNQPPDIETYSCCFQFPQVQFHFQCLFSGLVIIHF